MQVIGSDRLRALLRDLRADDRILLECRIVDGWHYGDIAVHLGVPRDVLADRVRRLRTDLRRKAKALGLSSFDGGAWRKDAVEVTTRTAKAGTGQLGGEGGYRSPA